MEGFLVCISFLFIAQYWLNKRARLLIDPNSFSLCLLLSFSPPSLTCLVFIHSWQFFKNRLSAAWSLCTDSPWCRVADGREAIYDDLRCGLLLPGLWVSNFRTQWKHKGVRTACDFSTLLLCIIAGKDEKMGACHFQGFMHSNQWGCF